LIAVSGLKAKRAGRIIRTVLVVCMGARVHGGSCAAILGAVRGESRLKQRSGSAGKAEKVGAAAESAAGLK
jgi:hypothetical protein